MRKQRHRNYRKASLSLASIIGREARQLRPGASTAAVGLVPSTEDIVDAGDTFPVLLEVPGVEALMQQLSSRDRGALTKLSGPFLSGQIDADLASRLIRNRRVTRLQTKKQSRLNVNEAGAEIGLLVPATGQRAVPEDGQGVLIGIVDSGFDLSHPMFRGANGNLRVERLLDQVGGGEFDQAQLELGWANGTNPGSDENGHGTHVATIAGGSRFGQFEGVASGARFLLVKSNLRDTVDAVQWIFDQAGQTPCVVNMSLGHHWGAHDGTDVEERFHEAVVGPGRIVVVSAGNERNDDIHLGGYFHPTQTETVVLDVLRQPQDPPFAVVTLWYSDQDDFDIELIAPGGQALPVPVLGNTDFFSNSQVEIELAASPYGFSDSVQVQVVLSFASQFVGDNLLQGWGLRMRNVDSAFGRIDGWVNNSGFGRFRSHPLVRPSHTVGLSATGRGAISVASHVTRNEWESDLGHQVDISEVLRRTSSFSSLGPTRDGRWKPDISAPGQYLTAALADGSGLATVDERALVNDRLLTIEGTSMAAPVVTGVIALLLQRNGALDPDAVRAILRQTAVHDGHTGPELWHPAYGYGKVDVAAALDQV